jgi:hypothetical protein
MEQVIHENDPIGNHRIVCGSYTSPWVAYKDIAALDLPSGVQIRATTNYHKQHFPRVFTLGVVDSIELTTKKH